MAGGHRLGSGWTATAAEWAEYVEVRRAQRFSVVQVHATRRRGPDRAATGHVPFAADGGPDPAYWRALEDEVAAANDRGLVVLLVGVGNTVVREYGERMTTPAFARYLAGRLAGHFVVLSPNMDSAHDPTNDEVGRPSAGQMTRLRGLFAGLDWRRLRPAPDLVRTQPDAPERKVAASRTEAGDLVVVYLPDNPDVELDLRTPPGPFDATWFDPVTGKTAPLAATVQNEAVTLCRPAGWDDAALLPRALPSPQK